MEPLNMYGHANTCEEELLEVCRERDELRTKNEGLKSAYEIMRNVADSRNAENERLRGDNERLRRIVDKLISEREHV